MYGLKYKHIRKEDQQLHSKIDKMTQLIKSKLNLIKKSQLSHVPVGIDK